MPQPRDRLDSPFREVVDEIYSTLTARAVESLRAHKDVRLGVAQPLPAATVQQIRGLLEAVAAPTCDGHAALDTLANSLGTSVTNLLPIAEALDILEFGEIKNDADRASRQRAACSPKARATAAGRCSPSTS